MNLEPCDVNSLHTNMNSDVTNNYAIQVFKLIDNPLTPTISESFRYKNLITSISIKSWRRAFLISYDFVASETTIKLSALLKRFTCARK